MDHRAAIMKCIAIVLALLGFGFGILAAYFWWRSSQAEFRISTSIPPIVMPTGPAVGLRDVENYLSEVGRLNKWAAIFTAIGVVLSTFSSVVSAAS
jgi:hypothetical protein